MSIDSVQSRIAEIRSLTTGLAPRAPAPAARSASFATALDAAVGAQETPSTQGPADLERFGNGQIPRMALRPVGSTGHRMWAPAATAMADLIAAADADGIDVRITDSYRTLGAQEDLARRKGLYKNGGLAATPGTSDHGWGLSVDIDTSGGTLAWLRENAARFGFKEDVPREPWHWTFDAGRPSA